MGVLSEDWKDTSESEANMNNSECALILSHASVSGVKNILPSEGYTKGTALKSDPNTNLMEPRAMIPTVQHRVDLQPGHEVMIATAVFAICNGKKHLTRAELYQRWCQQPRLTEYILRQI